ncbi:MAG: precorrin-3B C(17)-methyltransferase [Bacteroidaceae bacterium]|nr:precorrin-3B C(17)-methyltransferase [Bacteroidaceae bacterium]
MVKGHIVVAGIGPGSSGDITPAVVDALGNSDVVIGYSRYFEYIRPWIPAGAECIDTGMLHERDRALQAFQHAEKGKKVCVVSSGDSGIYGMAPLVFEMQRELDSKVEVTVLPGISAFQKAASLLGAPVGHDFCVISLSDLMTPWESIEKRIKAAASADFITAVYNPKSNGRYWQLYRLKEIFMRERKADTPVGYVRQAGRSEEKSVITTLSEFDPEQIDMFTIVLIGNSTSYNWNGHFITPRGYYREQTIKDVGIGQNIMIKSFLTIQGMLKNRELPLGHKWALLHAIHTTADFEMQDLLYSDEGVVEKLHSLLAGGVCRTIITDVTMVASGIRKGAVERLGLEVRCYLSDSGTSQMTREKGITRAQAGIRMAVEEHPDALYVFGNAPTALMELCDLMRKGKAHPCGIIAAPVGFIHVLESKYMVKSFTTTPKIIVEGRKGGSTLAATLVNSILTFDDAGQLKPGRDV